MGKERPSTSKGIANPEKWVADHRSGERKCLRCQRPFFSFHAGHRICARCTDLDSYKDDLGGVPTHGVLK